MTIKSSPATFAPDDALSIRIGDCLSPLTLVLGSLGVAVGFAVAMAAVFFYAGVLMP